MMCNQLMIVMLVAIIAIVIFCYTEYAFANRLALSLRKFWPATKVSIMPWLFGLTVDGMIPMNIRYRSRWHRITVTVSLPKSVPTLIIRRKTWMLDYFYYPITPKLINGLGLELFSGVYEVSGSLESFNESIIDDWLKQQLLLMCEYSVRIMIKQDKLIIKARQIGLRENESIEAFVHLTQDVVNKVAR